MAKDERLIDVTLGSLCDGQAEAQFQECLIRADELLANTARYKGSVSAKCVIDIKVEIERDLETGFYRFNLPGVTMTEPKKKAITRAAYVRDGSFKIEKPTEQLSILRPPKAAEKEE